MQVCFSLVSRLLGSSCGRLSLSCRLCNRGLSNRNLLLCGFGLLLGFGFGNHRLLFLLLSDSLSLLFRRLRPLLSRLLYLVGRLLLRLHRL